MSLKIIEPWEEIINPSAMEAQLKKELSINHPLYEKSVKAIAKRGDCDDVLFENLDYEEFYVVHLTWSSSDFQGKYPKFETFANIENANIKMQSDNAEFEVY